MVRRRSHAVRRRIRDPLDACRCSCWSPGRPGRARARWPRRWPKELGLPLLAKDEIKEALMSGARGRPRRSQESRRLGRAAVMAMLAAARSVAGCGTRQHVLPVHRAPPRRSLPGALVEVALPVPAGACAGALPRPQRDAAHRPSRRRTAVRGAVERAPPDAARPRPGDRGRHRRTGRHRASLVREILELAAGRPG